LTVTGSLSDSTAVTVATGATYNVNASDTLGSIAGAGLITTTASSGTITLTTGNDNTSTSFSGALQDGLTATLALTKMGSGTLTLLGTNTYTAGTNISAGTLA
jgi:autotransporter-associated beta strand protein